MNRPIPPTAPDEQRSHAERHTAVMRIALVGGIFCAVAIALLAVNHAQSLRVDPTDSDELRALKDELRQRPKDEELKGRIRTLDEQLRRAYFQRQTRAVQGGWLLLAGGAVFFLALRAAAGYRPVPPQLPVPADEVELQAREAARARWSAAALGVAAVAGGAALLCGPYATTPAGTASGPETVAPAEPPPSDEEMARNWPRFRGPDGLGVSAHKEFPGKWDGKKGENIRWKTALPLPGASSPIVWGNRIFLTGGNEAAREVYCVDTETGQLVWKQQTSIPNSPQQPPKTGKETGYAASTPATDGRRVYAIFGNGDVAALDFSGKQIWGRSLGLPRNRYGHAASLLTYRNLVIIPWDQEVNGKLLALDGATGKTAWEVLRTVDCAWTTPIVAPGPAGGLVIACAPPKIAAYNVADGKEAWFVTGLAGDIAASPLFTKGLVLFASAHVAAMAIKPGGQGNVTKTHVVWRAEEGLPDTASPLTDGQHLWLVTSEGLFTCYAAADGRKLYEKDLDEGCYASPSLAGGRVILFGVSGAAVFLSPGDSYKELGRAEMGEEVHTSPAFQDGRIYVRGKKHLYCIGASGGEKK